MTKKHLFRRLLRWSAIIFAALILLVAIVFLTMQTPPAKSLLGNWLAETMSTPPHQVVHLDNLKGILPFRVSLQDFSIADAEGEWLEVHDLSIRWHALKLLTDRQIDFQFIRAQEIRLHRLPAGAEEPAPKEAAAENLLQRVREWQAWLPLVQELGIMRLELGAALAGEDMALQVSGHLWPDAVAPQERLHLIIEPIAPEQQRPRLQADIAWSQAAELSVQISVRDSESGAFAAMTGTDRMSRLNLQIDGAGPLSNWHGQLQLTAEDLLSLQMTAQVTQRKNGYALALDAVLQPHEDAVPEFEQLLQGSPVELQLRATWLPEATVELSQLNLKLGEEVTILAEGRLDAAAEQGLFQLEFSTSELTGRLEARLDSPRLYLDGLIEQNRLQELVWFNINLPLTFSWPPVNGKLVQLHFDGGLEGTLRMNSDIATLPVAIPGTTIAGLLTVDLVLSGTPARPAVDGVIELQDGRYENLRSGILLRHVMLQAAATTEQLQVTTFRAETVPGGNLTGTGTVSLLPADRFPFDLNFNLTNMQPFQRDDLQVNISGQLQGAGTFADAMLKGTLALGPAQYQIGVRSGADIPVLEVSEIDAAEEATPHTAVTPERNGFTTNLQLQIAVNFPNRIFIRGRGLDTEWQGQLSIGGTVEAPTVTGQLEVLRGRIDFAGRRINITRGVIHFHGDIPLSATLDIVAETNVENVQISVIISGSVDDPQIELQSEPQLPEDEILSFLLFGKSLTAITPFQAIRIALALRALSGAGGRGVTERVRNFLNVDEVSIRPVKEGGTAVGVGKYIADDVYIDVSMDVEEGGGRVMLEIELTPSITLRSGVGTDAGGEVGLRWRFRY